MLSESRMSGAESMQSLSKMRLTNKLTYEIQNFMGEEIPVASKVIQKYL